MGTPQQSLQREHALFGSSPTGLCKGALGMRNASLGVHSITTYIQATTMVTIARRRRSRPPLWQIRLALYGLSALALLFSVCLVFTDLVQQAANNNDMMLFEPPHRKLSRPQDEMVPKQDPTGTPGGVVVTSTNEEGEQVPQHTAEEKVTLAQSQPPKREEQTVQRPKDERDEIISDQSVESEKGSPIEPLSNVELDEPKASGGESLIPPVQVESSDEHMVPGEQTLGHDLSANETPLLQPPETSNKTPESNNNNQKEEYQPPANANENPSIVLATEATTVKKDDSSPPVDTVSTSDELPLKPLSEQQEAIPNTESSPSPTMFVLVADSRAASDWIMSRLDLHPEVCASSETGGLNNGDGYPLGCMLPDGMPWLQDSDPRQGCILAFIRPKVKEFIQQSEYTDGKWKLPQRCQEDYDSHEDPIQVHLTRLCKFTLTVLERDEYDTSSEEAIDISITHAYMAAFQHDGQDVLACKCPETTKVRGVKVLTDWIPSIHGFLDRHEGVRVLRLRRRNTFARFLSFQTAIKTNIWQTHSAEEKHRQLEALPSDWTVDVDDMLRTINEMDRASAEADTWADEHAHDAGRDVFPIEYEDCRDRPEECFIEIFSYLGIEDSQKVLEENKNNFMSTFKDSIASNPESLLEKMTNQDLVREALSGSDFGAFIGADKTLRPIQHIQLHIDPFTSKQINHHHPFMIGGVNRTSVYFEGEGLKFQPVLYVLKTLPHDDVAAVSIHDISSVVMLNPSLRSNSQAYQARSNFRRAIQDHADHHKVMVSTTDICCAAALSHVQPTSLVTINPENSHVERRAQSCCSGTSDCLWVSDDNASTWKHAFESMASRAQKTPEDPIYLDGSLIAGVVSDVIEILEELVIRGDEDERAVFTDFLMQDKAERLQLDYDSILVERQPIDTRNNKVQGCFEGDVEKTVNPLLHVNTKQTLFIRTERQLGCKSEVNVMHSHPIYPSWESGGIGISPVLEHADDLLLRDKSMDDIDRHFGKEIFYAVTDNGIFASGGRNEKFRTEPTERFIDRAFGILRESLGSGIWPDLEKVLGAGGFPYLAWYGDYRGCNLHNKEDHSIPLFTASATIGCKHAFPSPSYMTVIDGKSKANDWFNYFQRFDHDYAWDTKIRKVFWRGTLSESDPGKVKTSIRWRVNKYVADRADELHDIFDVGFTNIPDYVISMAGVEASQAGGLKNEVKPMIEFQKYLAILDMDGNSWSSRFSNLLCYNSVVLKIEPGFVDDFYYHLVPWRHYIPVKDNLEDLEEKAKFVVDPANENVLKEIVYNANQWCSEHMLQDRLAHDQIELWEKYVRLLDQGDANWQNSWLEKKALMLQEGNDYGMVALG